MASYRRRGAHAARVVAAAPASVGQPVQPGADQVAPSGGQAAGGGPPRRKRPKVLRSRPSVAKVIAAVLVVGFGAMGFAGGLWSTPSAEPTVQAFLLAWQEQRYQAAAALTTGDRAKVAAALSGAYQQLDAAAFYLTMGPIVQRGDTATASFGASVDLGQDGAPWTYTGKFTLRVTGSEWRIVWSPSVIFPRLKPGYRLAVRSRSEPRQVLLDSAGKPLQPLQTVYLVGVRPDRLAHPAATARALSRITGIDEDQLLGWIHAAPTSGFQELVTLSPQMYRRHEAALQRVRDLVIKPRPRRLFASIAPAVVGRVDTEASQRLRDEGIAYRPGATIGLSGLQLAFQRPLAGTPTTEVVMETAGGGQVQVLAQWQGSAPKAVTTTIDSRVQQAAQGAISSLPVSGAVVAVQASTGRILAVARHGVRGLPRIKPLSRGYPPGTAFTIVSAAALLAQNLSVDAPVPCTRANAPGGTGAVFKNTPPVLGLGSKATFADDFSHACATAFTSLSLTLKASQLNATAAGFGFGAPLRLKVPAFSRAVQAGDSDVQRATATIGRGGVRTSPLQMALAAARVDSGTWHAPVLVAGSGANSNASARTGARGAGMSAASMDALRTLMRKAAKVNGAARADAHGEQVYGQVGAARFTVREHHLWATWFVGYRGDVAFAVVELSASQYTSAVAAARAFLDAVPRH